MRIENPKYVCDWCRVALDGEIIRYGSQKEREKHHAAVRVMLTHSEGGWGNRVCLVDNQWEEVCLDCFKQYKIIAEALTILTGEGVSTMSITEIDRCKHHWHGKTKTITHSCGGTDEIHYDECCNCLEREDRLFGVLPQYDTIPCYSAQRVSKGKRWWRLEA